MVSRLHLSAHTLHSPLRQVGNALFKFTYLKKANDTEGTLDTAQTAINNTLRSLLLQLKPGPVLKRNLTPAAAVRLYARSVCRVFVPCVTFLA